MNKLLRGSIAVLLVSLSLLLVCVVYTIVRSPDVAPVPLLGNSAENIARIPEPASPAGYSFVVVGDSKHGDEVFETLIHKADAVENLKFGVHLGDFVPHSTPGEFAFFVHEFSEHPHFPLLMVPGNHDVNPDEDKSGLFEKVMGPRQVWFKYRNDLFVIADNAVRPTAEAHAWVERVLAEQGKSARNIFVFLHRPVFSVDQEADRLVVDRGDPFHVMLKKAKVRYVFAGHYHSYLREDVDGVNCIVTGGGGSETYGRRAFYHAVVADVEGNRAQESLITTPFKFGLDDEVAGALYELFYGHYRVRPVLFLALAAFAQIFIIWAMTGLFRRRRLSPA